MKQIRVILILLIIFAGLGAGVIYLLSLGVGNGGLGSSYTQYVDLKNNTDESAKAYTIFKEACNTPDVDESNFAAGLTTEQADTCNSDPNKSGISFVGGNGNEMYLLSHNLWDKRVLYATYYLLQRGFSDSKYSLKMDCSANGFEPRTKMTLGVHYGQKGDQIISYIKSITDPSPDLAQQYISGDNKYSPEGTESQVSSNSISPHAYGQALDVYSYGCTSVYVRLDSDQSASRYACGRTESTYSHTYFYPIKNIQNKIEYIDSSAQIDASPDTNQKNPPDTQPNAPYTLTSKPDLAGCNSQPVIVVASDNLCQNDSKNITYTIAGCIAQNQTTDYTSPYYYLSYTPNTTAQLIASKASRVQPYQYIAAPLDPLAGDNCACTDVQKIPTIDTSGTASMIGTGNSTSALMGGLLSVPQNTDYASSSLANPLLDLAVPENQKVIKNQNFAATSSSSTSPEGQLANNESKDLAEATEKDLEEYIAEQAKKARRIVLESSLLFSLAKNNSSNTEANEYYKDLVGDLPETEMTINQIATPNTGSFNFPDQYNVIAGYIYGTNSGMSYDPSKTIGLKRGLGYNATDKDRIHLGF